LTIAKVAACDVASFHHRLLENAFNSTIKSTLNSIF
jgi:hypothetical protein